MLARDEAQCCKWDALFSPADSRHQAKLECVLVFNCVCACVSLCNSTMCVCLQGLYSVCVCVCLPVCIYHTLTLAAGCLQYLPAALLFSYTHTHTLSSLFLSPMLGSGIDVGDR